MATGFDAAAGAVGFASLGVLLLQGCVKGFVLLRTAQNFGHDADVTRSEIEYQQYRVFTWAEKVGLESDSPTRNMNWEIVHGHLKKLESLLTDTAKFKTNYRLEVIKTDDKLAPGDLIGPKKGFRRMFRPEFHNDTAQKLHQSVTVWKRLKWAAIDKDGVGLLIGDIRRFVDDLWDLLRDDDLKFLRSGMEALLRHAISQTQDQTALSQIEAIIQPKRHGPSAFEHGSINSALFLKKQSLMFGYDETSEIAATSSATKSDPKMAPRSLSGATLVHVPSSASSSRIPPSRRSKVPHPALSYKLLELGPESNQDLQTRELAKYSGAAVFVEWKIVERLHERPLKHRIKTLATLLQDIDLNSFHSLKCLGYLKDPKTENYGYVFKAPPDSSSFVSLDRLLEDHDTAPSLDDRLALAIALVETVLQLHTSGWLHKGLRSENVVFFREKGEVGVVVTNVFLEGYEYARADNPSDMTESPIPQQEANLYRHPELLRANRGSFRKAFDLYGLGCVLLEIGLWESLTTILLYFHRNRSTARLLTRIPPSALNYESKAEAQRVNETRTHLLTESGAGTIESALEFAIGKAYANIVRKCLSAGEVVAGTENPVDDTDIEDDFCIDLELEILRKLEYARDR